MATIERATASSAAAHGRQHHAPTSLGTPRAPESCQPPNNKQQQQQQQFRGWPPGFPISSRPGMALAMSSSSSTCVAAGISDWSPRQRAKGAAGGPEAGVALATRLREDMASLLEMGLPRPGQELASKKQRERFQHALAVLAKVRRGPQLEEALLLACTTVDRHLVRFVGAELEAAAALLSILATESSARCAKAMAAKVAYETAQAGGAGAGSGPAKHKQQEEEEDGRLPLSVLVAAVRSLRTLSASAVAIEKSV
ncbi:unnamed protein product, partial [Ectocarpus sp. 12 AP-2014]